MRGGSGAPFAAGARPAPGRVEAAGGLAHGAGGRPHALLRLIFGPFPRRPVLAEVESLRERCPRVAGVDERVAGMSLEPVLLVAHGIGVFAGSKNATKINQTLLKRIVAVASIAIACIKLFL